MFDTIILLAGQAEQAALPAALHGHNPRLTVISVGTSADLDAMDPDVLARARLIAFVTPEIVSAVTLARLGYGALNFHPGPPDFPGWAPAHLRSTSRQANSARPSTAWSNGSMPARSSASCCFRYRRGFPFPA